jgi:hypothetical protein
MFVVQRFTRRLTLTDFALRTVPLTGTLGPFSVAPSAACRVLATPPESTFMVQRTGAI